MWVSVYPSTVNSLTIAFAYWPRLTPWPLSTNLSTHPYWPCIFRHFPIHQHWHRPIFIHVMSVCIRKPFVYIPTQIPSTRSPMETQAPPSSLSHYISLPTHSFLVYFPRQTPIRHEKFIRKLNPALTSIYCARDSMTIINPMTLIISSIPCF